MGGNVVQSEIPIIEKFGPPVFAMTIGATRQLLAEGSKVVEAGFTHDNILLNFSIYMWRLIELESHPDFDKFPDGFDGFDVNEELTEGMMLAAPGLALAYIIDHTVIEPLLSRLNQQDPNVRAIRLGIKSILYTGFSQASYQCISQMIVPKVKSILGVHDLEPSLRTLIEVVQVLGGIYD